MTSKYIFTLFNILRTADLLHVGGDPVLPHAEHQELLLQPGDGGVLVSDAALELPDLGAGLAQQVLVVLLHPPDAYGHLLLPVAPDLLQPHLQRRYVVDNASVSERVDMQGHF